MRAMAFGLLSAGLISSGALADALDEQATALFTANFRTACVGAFGEDGALVAPVGRQAMPEGTHAGEESGPVDVWVFRCHVGAYNTQSVLIAHSPSLGMRQLSLARPDLDIVRESPNDEESALKELKIAGWSASPIVVNAVLDPSSGELRETANWRGAGDASSTATWQWTGEHFRLVGYQVDATYDGRSNPKSLLAID